MGDIAYEVATDIPSNSTTTTPDPPASTDVICEEFLKVLGRKEVEQPMIWYIQVAYRATQPHSHSTYGPLAIYKT